MVCVGIVYSCEHKRKLSKFLILMALMSQQNPMQTFESEWMELLQKTAIMNRKKLVSVGYL